MSDKVPLPSVHTVGNTPLQRVDLRIDGRWREVWLKLEGANPGGSIKDRTAQALIEALDREGRLRPGSTVVESTSGNLGVALAMMCRARGMKFVAVVDPAISDEKLNNMSEFDAEIEMVGNRDDSGRYLLARLRRVRELCASSSTYVWTNQYGSTANPSVHFATTAPELRSQLAGRLDVVFIAVSTGGTLAGIAAHLRKVDPQARIVAVDARGSRALGCVPGHRLLTGIGSARESEFVTRDLYDDVYIAEDAMAFSVCRALWTELGVSVGGSSGAAIAACARYLQAQPAAGRAVCVCPDAGGNYGSTIFNDQWLSESGLGLTDADLAPISGFRHGA